MRRFAACVCLLAAFAACSGSSGGTGSVPDANSSDVLDEAGPPLVDAATDEPAAIDATKPPSPCENITPDPSGSAQKNWQTIQTCLNAEKEARLKPGIYPIAQSLSIPPSAQLVGNTSYPTLRLEATATGNAMIKFQSGSPPDKKARVAFLRLDAQNVIGGRPNASIVFPSSNTKVDNNFIFNSTPPPFGKGAAAVYVLCGPCSGAEIVNNKIYNAYYGLIFGPKNTSKQVNVAVGNQIHDIRCDSITFVSYGVADSNKIYDNGWGCENGAIPGGGIYKEQERSEDRQQPDPRYLWTWARLGPLIESGHRGELDLRPWLPLEWSALQLRRRRSSVSPGHQPDEGHRQHLREQESAVEQRPRLKQRDARLGRAEVLRSSRLHTRGGLCVGAATEPGLPGQRRHHSRQRVSRIVHLGLHRSGLFCLARHRLRSSQQLERADHQLLHGKQPVWVQLRLSPLRRQLVRGYEHVHFRVVRQTLQRGRLSTQPACGKLGPQRRLRVLLTRRRSDQPALSRVSRASRHPSRGGLRLEFNC